MLRHRHLLLRVLKLRAVINDTSIYELKEKQPVIINCKEAVIRIIITNGFHCSREVVIHQKPGTYFFEVESYIDDIQLLTGLMLALLFFLIFIFSGVRFFMLMANLPILVFLYVFYIKRKNFIQIHRLNPDNTITRN